MLWVTMAMVQESFNCTRSSSIFAVAYGIERGAGLVEEQDFRFDGQTAGDAEALLLATGKFIGPICAGGL
jgi:hypothetical protein